MKVWIDGRIVDAAQACIPVTDHGFLYGDGVFEGLRVERGRIFRLAGHLARLETSARAIALELPKSRAEIAEIVTETARAFGREEAYLRLVVSRGDGPLGINPAQCTRARIVCIAGEIRMFSDEKLAQGLDLLTASIRRPPADVLDPRVKSLNYLNNVLATAEARSRGADDALVLNTQGTVAEASAANVFVVHGRKCMTPPATDGALEGIVRGAVLELAAAVGLEGVEGRLGRVDFFAADEAFLTGTGAGIVAVRSLDGRRIGAGRRGPATERIMAAFSALVAREGTSVECDRAREARVA